MNPHQDPNFLENLTFYENRPYFMNHGSASKPTSHHNPSSLSKTRGWNLQEKRNRAIFLKIRGKICTTLRNRKHYIAETYTHSSPILIMRNIQTGFLARFPLHTQFSHPDIPSLETLNPLELSKKDWDRAREKYRAIEPLLLEDRYHYESFRKRSRETGISINCLGKWIKNYLRAGKSLAGLLERRRGIHKDGTRLTWKQNAIIEKVLSTTSLSDKTITIQSIVNRIHNACGDQVRKPCYTTIYKRVMKKRHALNKRKKAYI